MKDSKNAQQRIIEFWRWFIHNESKCRSIVDLSVTTGDELYKQLQLIDKNVFIELGPVNQDKRELIFSTAGCAQFFSLVDEIVKAAPPLVYWKIIALKPARGFPLRLTFGEQYISPKALYFLPLRKHGDPLFLGLKISISADYDISNPKLRTAIFHILDSGLGERECGTYLKYLELCHTSSALQNEGFSPLTELPTYFERWKRANNLPPKDDHQTKSFNQ